MSIHSRVLKTPLSTLALASMAFLLAGCGGGTGDTASGSGTPLTAPRNAAACNDFYAYANSAWIAATPIPAGHASIDFSTGVAARNQAALLADLDRLAAGDGTASTPDQQALVDLLASRADTAAVERAGLAPLADDLALIDRMTDVGQLPATWGSLMRRGVRLPVSLKVEVFDDAETSDPGVHVDRLRVALDPVAPARPADASPDGPTSEAAFRAHVARTLALTGMSAAEAEDIAGAVAAIEQALATSTKAAATTPAEAAATPFAMPALLAAAGVPDALPRVVDEATLGALGNLQASFGAAQWRGFMRWRLARSFTDHLPARFAAERARWDPPALAVTDDDNEPVDARIAFLAGVLPRQLDLFFTARVLPADTAAQTRDIGGGVRAALHRYLDSRDWLSAASRAASHRLLDSVELVFPALDNVAEDRANAGLVVPTLRRDALLDNVRRAAAYDLDRRFGLALASRTGRSFNGDAWSHFEGRYDYLSHSVVIGPATVQAVLADAGTPAARYGALGSVIAHELLHMFGAPTDLAIRPRQPLGWIAGADRPYFNGMVARLENDYAAWVTTRYGVAVVKPRFMGEDLSDLGSVPVALSALHHESGTDTDDDAFYRAFAAIMRTRQSDAEDRSYLASVPAHALYPYRINGPLSNFAPFSRTYGCAAGDAMVRGAETRVELW